MGEVLSAMLCLFSIVFLEAAAIGSLLSDRATLMRASRGGKIQVHIVPDGYKPELDKSPKDGIIHLFLTESEYRDRLAAVTEKK